MAFAKSDNYQQLLINKAKKLNLAQSEDWLNMVYYQKNKLSKGYNSIFDSENFFLSKEGKTNPQKELEATISSFFNNDFLPFKNVFGSNQTAQCAFKGRYEWLKEKLQFDFKKLPEQKCPDFKKWYNDINPKSAILIFSSSYLNNPASMFGHTFLLINSDDDKKNERIVSKALNYSATTDETNGIIFAYKGIFGLYKGQFNIMPYYKMIKKYNNSENRDLWEYDLDLSKKELRQLITNLWEINNNYANYYFFSENCSYLLLKLLQRVKPEIKDDKNIINWVIPSDTIIDVAKVPNLIKKTKYRPSRASRINHLSEVSGKEVSKLAAKIAKNKDINEQRINSLEINQQKLLYDLAYEYLQYNYQKTDEFSRDEMAKYSLALLKKRSQLSGKTNLEKIKAPKSNPLLGHDPGRLFIAYGNNNIRKDFIQFDLRPAYHDLIDNDDGFLKGAQINVLDLSLRYFTEHDDFKLNHFNIVDIKSYSPRSFLFKPISWELRAGAENLYISKQNFDLAAVADFALGANFEIEQLKSNISILGAGLTYYGENIPTNHIYGVGPKLNIITNLTKLIKLNFSFRHHFFFKKQNFDFSQYRIEQNFKLKKNLSFRINYQKKDYRSHESEDEFGMGVNYYF